MADFPIEALKRYTVLAAIHTNNNFDKKDVMENVNKNMLEAAKTIKEIDMLFGRNQPQQPQQPINTTHPPTSISATTNLNTSHHHLNTSRMLIALTNF